MAAKPTPYRHKNGTVRYKVRFRLTPGANPVSESFDTLDGALGFADLVDAIGGKAAREMRHSSDRADRKVPTLATYLDLHLDRMRSHATPGTIADYRRMAQRTFLPTLGKLPLTAITRDAIVGWVADQRQVETDRSIRARAKARRENRPEPPPRTYAPKSIANAHGLLSDVLSAAVDDEHIGRNPARGVRLPSDHERAERVYLTPNEFTALYAHIADHYKPLVATLYGTGMRWGEATALRVGDIDTNAGVITVRQAWKKGDGSPYLGSAKSRRGHRTITVAESLRRLLVDHLAGKDTDDLAFTTVNGKRVRSQNFHPRIWHTAVAASGLSKRPDVHSLRHSHVSALIAEGVGLAVIQSRLGHEDISTTINVYGHLLPDTYAGAAEASERALAGALPQIEG